MGHSESYILGFDFGLCGLLVTAEAKFFQFDLELSADLADVVAVHEFSDVTAEQNMSTENKGIGKGYATLAVAVMEALNA
jgi:hypothetical protein